VRAIIVARDVEVLAGAAQFNSIWKSLDGEQQDQLKKSAKRDEKLSTAGLADAPAVFRKLRGAADREVRPFINGEPNPARRVLGGIVVNPCGSIEREVTVNLVALRSTGGATEEDGKAIRRYLLGLSLLAATTDQELYLRQGCMLRYADAEDHWQLEPRRGEPRAVSLTAAHSTILKFAREAAKPFQAKWPKVPQGLRFKFSIEEAKKLVAKADDDEAAG
jgi:CRISPR-associated protein Csb1